jgi:hypothetical protein
MGCDVIFARPAEWRSFTRTIVRNVGLTHHLKNLDKLHEWAYSADESPSL